MDNNNAYKIQTLREFNTLLCNDIKSHGMSKVDINRMRTTWKYSLVLYNIIATGFTKYADAAEVKKYGSFNAYDSIEDLPAGTEIVIIRGFLDDKSISTNSCFVSDGHFVERFNIKIRKLDSGIAQTHFTRKTTTYQNIYNPDGRNGRRVLHMYCNDYDSVDKSVMINDYFFVRLLYSEKDRDYLFNSILDGTAHDLVINHMTNDTRACASDWQTLELCTRHENLLHANVIRLIADTHPELTTCYSVPASGTTTSSENGKATKTKTALIAPLSIKDLTIDMDKLLDKAVDIIRINLTANS